MIRVSEGRGTLTLNESATDDSALSDFAQAGDQYAQNEDKPTFAKGEGLTVTVDTAG